jgi:hypothetical protein
MLISEMIHKLQCLQDEAGDLEVGMLTEGDGTFVYQNYLDIDVISIPDDKGKLLDPCVVVAWPDILPDDDDENKKPNLKIV